MNIYGISSEEKRGKCIMSNSGHQIELKDDDYSYPYKKHPAGFPSDSTTRLCQMADGEASLDLWYAHQFVQNETLTHPGGGTSLVYFMEHTPVIAGTVTGTAYDGDEPVATFVISSAGTFTFMPIGNHVGPLSGLINLTTGVITLEWSVDPGVNKIVVNYEYNLEAQYYKGDQDVADEHPPWGGAVNQAEKHQPTRGIVVVYVDVGQLPPFKAEAFVARVKDDLSQSVKKIQSEGIEVWFLPTRQSGTRVEIVPFPQL